MNNKLDVLVEGVLVEAQKRGLSAGSVTYYRSRCRAVVRFCQAQGVERLTADVVDEFLAMIGERTLRGEITSLTRSTLEKTVRMMFAFQQSGAVDWGRRRPPSGLSAADEGVLDAFATSLQDELSAGSIRLLIIEVRQFLRFLERIGRQLDEGSSDDVREFLVEVRPRHNSGMSNTVWALKRFFRFAKQQGLVGINVETMLARVGPRRSRALPCFTPEEIDRILAVIETDSPLGKRDYGMVQLALSTGLRCCDLVALRMEEIDWRHDEISIIQSKTSAPLSLPLQVEAGNAIADWLLKARPSSEAPEVFVRLYAPFRKLAGSTGAQIMSRWLEKADVSHHAHDGKTFHALRRTTGTRLVESGAELALTAQVLGHASIESSRRYIALADRSLRECCLPLDGFVIAKEGLR